MKKYIVLAIMLLSLLISGVPTSLEAAPKKASPTSEKKEKKTKKVKKRSASGADYNALNFLPFGVGQFRQGRPLMGGVLGGGQAMMLFLYMDRKKQIDASNADAASTINEIPAGSTPSDETLAYLDANSAYVKKTNSEATLCLLGFVGLYAASVVDAVWDPFSMRKSAVRKAAEIEEMDDDAGKWAAEKKLESIETRPRLSAFALPTLDKSKSTFGLSLEKSFR